MVNICRRVWNSIYISDSTRFDIGSYVKDKKFWTEVFKAIFINFINSVH